MPKLKAANAHRVQLAAHRDAGQVAKVIGVQEAQIADLTAQLLAERETNANLRVENAALTAVLVGVAAMGRIDEVDPQTGEIARSLAFLGGAGDEWTAVLDGRGRRHRIRQRPFAGHLRW